MTNQQLIQNYNALHDTSKLYFENGRFVVVQDDDFEFFTTKDEVLFEIQWRTSNDTR